MNYVLYTNILIYAIDERDTKKAAIAKKLLEHAVRSQGNIPRQVLGELLNLGHKRAGLMLDNTRTLARLLEASIRVIDTDGPAMRSASELAEHHKLQYFDALICTIAKMSGASILFSEDMHDGLRLGSLMIANPFNIADAAVVSSALDQ